MTTLSLNMMTLLLIDDTKVEHKIFARAVERLNNSVNFVAVSGCEEALEKIPSALVPLPDYIFLDLDMPIVDGYACFKMLKSHKFLKDIPVVLYSSDTQSKGMIHMLKNGALCHLNKSDDYLELTNDLELILRPENRLSGSDRPSRIV